MTSNDVVQQAKRLFFANKVGHTGALDPLATGILPLCFGEATKFSQYLLDADKVYESEFCFGVETSTADADGETIQSCDASGLSKADVEGQLPNFVGDIKQTPPMYSALKKDGQPLYKLARQGIVVEREARPVSISEYRLLDFVPGEKALARVRIACSKGTYVRSLAEELGRKLGVGAHVQSLRRLRTGEFDLACAHTLEALTAERGDERAEVLDHHLLPVDAAVRALPKIELDEHSAHYFARGQAIMDSQAYRLGEEGDTVRVFRPDGVFLGLGEITDEGSVQPKRLVCEE
jgi:tRNA pseudouridine55 synthase